MARAALTKLSADGRSYLCVLDNAVIPDGCWVQGTWNASTGAVTGVRAIRSGNVTMHQCGTVTGLSTNKWNGQG